MRSALYFPHVEVDDKALLKSGLLLWDELKVIVPFEGYRPHYSDPEMARCFDLIGKCHYPTDDEKSEAHQLIADFASRPLPEAFNYSSAAYSPNMYNMYPQKLLPDTWDLLHDLGLAGDSLPNLNYPTSRVTGLSLMNILADCCAGDALARVTDERVAYANLTGLLFDQTAIPATGRDSDTREWLVLQTMKVLNLDEISVDSLIAFRLRERNERNGAMYADLRHRYTERLGLYIEKLAAVKDGAAKDTWEAEFAADMRADVATLRTELRATWADGVFNKEMIVPVVMSTLGAVAYFHGLPVPPVAAEVFSAAGIPITGAGLVSVGSKFARGRIQTLQSHPMAYLYELKGGVRW